MAIGLGLNVANAIPADLAGRAAALNDFCAETTVEALAEPIARALATVDLEAPRLTPEELCGAPGARLAARPRHFRPAGGTGAGIDEHGRLVVRDAAGSLQRVAIGDVVQA